MFLWTEVWRRVPGYDGIEVSSNGRVRSWVYYGKRRVKPRLLKQRLTKGGMRVTLWCEHAQKSFFVHRLVLLAFVGPSELTVIHLDGNLCNNQRGNLHYSSQRDNMRYAVDVLGRQFGQHPGLPVDKKAKARELAKQGKRPSAIAKRIGVSVAQVRRVTRGLVPQDLAPAPKTKKPSPPSEQDSEIRRLSANGMTYREIGKLFALSQDQVYRIASGLVRPDESQLESRKRKTPAPTAQDEEVRRLYDEGHTQRVISERFGLSPDQVHRIVNYKVRAGA